MKVFILLHETKSETTVERHVFTSREQVLRYLSENKAKLTGIVRIQEAKLHLAEGSPDIWPSSGSVKSRTS